MSENQYSKEMPPGWVQAKYQTATHVLIGYLMEPDSEFRKRWESFNKKWKDASSGLEMRVKMSEVRHAHQGFGEIKMREAVQRALNPNKSRAAGAIDILRLDRILIRENLSPLQCLDPKAFVAKSPGSKREAHYRKHGVPAEIRDDFEVLRYIKRHGPPISQTSSTKRRGGRDPRIKAQRVMSEWIRELEVRALDHLLEEMAKDLGTETTESSREALLETIRK